MEEKEPLAALLGAFPIRLYPVGLQGVRAHALGDRLQLPEQGVSDFRLDVRLVEELERLNGQVVQFDVSEVRIGEEFPVAVTKCAVLPARSQLVILMPSRAGWSRLGVSIV